MSEKLKSEQKRKAAQLRASALKDDFKVIAGDKKARKTRKGKRTVAKMLEKNYQRQTTDSNND